MSGRAALAFSVASAFGAALNYLFQVHAATVLDAAAFGLLSAWLARVTLLGIVATVVQFVSLDYQSDDPQFRRLLRIAGVLSFFIVGAYLAVGAQIAPLWIGASAVIGGIVLYAAVGQLQARLRLGVVAVALTVTAAVRFGLPFAWPRDARAPAFYVAHAAAFFAGVVAAAAATALLPASTAAPDVTPPPQEPVVEGRLRLKRPLLLAFAAVLFPLLDVLIISATHDAATTGAYSRVALASRVVLFAGVAALQILLPHQLHVAITPDAKGLPPFAAHLQRWLTPAMLAGAMVLATLLDQAVLHLQGEERVWLFGSCLTAALLVALLGQINRFAARGSLGVAAVCVGGIVLTSAAAAGLCALTDHAPVTRYVLAVLAGDALVLFAASVAQMRHVPAAA